jgi:hypothetical protein
MRVKIPSKYVQEYVNFLESVKSGNSQPDRLIYNGSYFQIENFLELTSSLGIRLEVALDCEEGDKVLIQYQDSLVICKWFELGFNSLSAIALKEYIDISLHLQNKNN